MTLPDIGRSAQLPAAAGPCHASALDFPHRQIGENHPAFRHDRDPETRPDHDQVRHHGNGKAGADDEQAKG
jgi:hypothetical protein